MPFRLWDRIRDWVILFTLLASAVGMMLALNLPLLRGLRALALDATSAVEAQFAWVGRFFRALDENEVLLEENIELSSELARLREARSENERLRGLLAFRDTTEYPLLTARVVSKDLFGQENYLTIDAGANDSVEVGMAVVDERGILGKVVLVSNNYSRVMPYLNTDFRVPAAIQEIQAAGILRWPGDHYDRLLLEHIAKTQPVQKGQLVVTSGVSGVFPPSYVIGTIDSIASQPARNAYDIYVKPAAPLSSAAYAFVVLTHPDPERLELEASIVE